MSWRFCLFCGLALVVLELIFEPSSIRAACGTGWYCGGSVTLGHCTSCYIEGTQCLCRGGIVSETFTCNDLNTCTTYVTGVSVDGLGLGNGCTIDDGFGGQDLSTCRPTTQREFGCCTPGGGGGSPTPTPGPTSSPTNAWWQLGNGGDVVVALAGRNGTITSRVPSGKNFFGGKNGSAIYGNNILGGISAENGQYLLKFNLERMLTKYENTFPSMRERILGQLTSTAENINGELKEARLRRNTPQINGVNIYYDKGSTVKTNQVISEFTDKALLLVEGDVEINDNITLGNGGFLAIIASGKITVAGNVDRLDGIYYAGTIFDTGTSGTKLIVNGTVVGMGGVSLERTYTDASNTPAENFYFRPDLTATLNKLGLRRKIVQELGIP